MVFFRKSLRKRHGHMQKLILVIFSLYIMNFVNSCSYVKAEKVRHRHVKQEDVYVSQLEKTSMENSSKRPGHLSCPNCIYKTAADPEEESTTDNLRLEAIKRQILSKLGLKQKPNVTYVLPKEVVMETIYRAEETSGFSRNFDKEEYPSTTSMRTNYETVDADDFYGRTSEIISFAEQGECTLDFTFLFITQFFTNDCLSVKVNGLRSSSNKSNWKNILSKCTRRDSISITNNPTLSVSFIDIIHFHS